MRNLNSLLISALLISSFSFMSCDGGGDGNNKTSLNGTIQQIIVLAEGQRIKFPTKPENKSIIKSLVNKLQSLITEAMAQEPGVLVSVEENGRTLDSDTTNESGEYSLRFTSETGMVTIRFEGTGFNLARVIKVTDDSVVTLNVNIDLAIPAIIFTKWEVLQDRISLNNNDEFIFDELEANFTINGDGRDCVRTSNSSSVIVRVKNITIFGCDRGLDSSNQSNITLEADEAINITSSADAIRSSNNSTVFVGKTFTPVSNTVSISSNRNFGIRGSEDSFVVIEPQGTCTISGADGAIRVTGNSIVTTGSCTLVGG